MCPNRMLFNMLDLALFLDCQKIHIILQQMGKKPIYNMKKCSLDTLLGTRRWH